jgi:hypothetical protein
MRQLLCLALFGLLTSTPALPAQKDYNGRWAIFGTTEHGRCSRGFRFKVRVFRGKAYIIGHSLSGARTAIGSRGEVSIRYVNGVDVITVSGLLDKRTGAGRWDYPTYRCVGWWRAKKL